MINQELIQEAADRLWNAESERYTCEPVRDILSTENLEAAYRCQAINTKRKEEAGERVIGYKVGLTSEAVQAQLGVDQPDFGVLTDARQIVNGGSLDASQILQPKIEAEIGFVLDQDLGQQRPDMDMMKLSISKAFACLEIVGSRVKNWDIRITDTIADNASASHFVMNGENVSVSEVDLEGCMMTMTRNGELVSKGVGRACLGNPMNAALWLAQTLFDLGTPMKAGDIILAGALGPMCPVSANDTFIAKIDGFPQVQVSFE